MTLTAAASAVTDDPVRRAFLAFCGPDTAEAVRGGAPDPTDVIAAAFEDTLEVLGDMPTPAAVLVDLGSGDVRSRVEQLARVCDADARVILIGSENDVSLYRDLMTLGVADYLVKPVTAEAVAHAIEAARTRAPADRAASPSPAGPEPATTIVSVTGARGGVGATTVAINVAWSLAHALERRVGLIDLDLIFGGVALDLDIDPGPGLTEALARPDRLDDLFAKRASVQAAPNLRVFAGEADPATAPDVTTAAVRSLIDHMRADVDVILIDLPRTLAAREPGLFDLIDTAVVVADPTLKALRDAARLKALAAPAETVVAALNRVGQAPKSELTPSAFEQESGMRVAARIPFDAGAARTAEAEGVCLTRAARRSKASKALAVFAKTLLDPVAPAAKRGLFSRLTGGRAA